MPLPLFARVSFLPFSTHLKTLHMSITGRSSRPSCSVDAESNNSNPNPVSESSADVSHESSRVYVRRKKTKMVVDVDGENIMEEIAGREVSGMIDIEDFLYDKFNQSATPSDVKQISPLSAKKREKVHLSIKQKANVPANWEEIFDGIMKMRSAGDAPVDTMGCEKAGISLPPKVPYRYPVKWLSSVILRWMTLTILSFTVNPRRSISKGCKDLILKCVSPEIVELCPNILPESVASSSCDWDYPSSLQLMAQGTKICSFGIFSSIKPNERCSNEWSSGAIKRLSDNGLLNPGALVKTDEATISSIIYPVGFYSRKAHYLKKVSEICLEKHEGDIPCSLNELLALPGIGPKMAHLIMNVGWNDVQGICVDTHVHRICNRLGWVSRIGTIEKTLTPEETRVSLEKWLPKDLWDPINPLLVGFGQTICTPVRPRCGTCGINKICPSAFKEQEIPNAKAKRSKK